MKDYDAIAVLLVEDDADDCRQIAKQLRDQNRRVVVDWAESVPAAAAKLERVRYDVILTDLSLPGTAGLRTVIALREKCGSLPIIVLTSLEDERLEQDLLEAGAQDYLVKGELNGRATLRAIIHAMQRQELLNDCKNLLAEREQDRLLLEQQAVLLRKKNSRLRRLYKTAQEFVDNVSHDFRTPLTVIKDYVAIIREGMVGPINDQQQGMLDKVAIRTDDLNHMVDDLLDMSKLESGLLGAWRRATSVARIMEHAETMLRQRAQVKKIDFVVECEANMPAVYCDADMIGRVIANLAVNAIKFSGEGSRVRLWAEADPVGRQVVIGVTDNGPGIDGDSLGKLFQRFHQLDSHVKPAVKGFGLGLNIAHQLSRINLGELSVRSRVGEGSTFSFTIPVADPPEVLTRWLRTQDLSRDALQLVEISISREATSFSADEFDRFLNCLLRKHDLLFRASSRQWLLMIAAPLRESNRWRERADEEFKRHNRNRPTGLLPDFHVETRGKWRTGDDHDAILDDFHAVLRQVHEVAGVKS